MAARGVAARAVTAAGVRRAAAAAPGRVASVAVGAGAGAGAVAPSPAAAAAAAAAVARVVPSAAASASASAASAATAASAAAAPAAARGMADMTGVNRELDERGQQRSLVEAAPGGLIATVFGATGLVGRYVVGRLGRVGAQIVVPYRGEEKAVRHLKVNGEVGQVAPFRYNTLKDRSPEHIAHLKKAVAHSNIVINLVGRTYPTRNFSVTEANVDTATLIAELCAAAPNVERLIHVSAVGCDEDHPSEFMRAKASAESRVLDIFPDATVLRLTQVFGAEDRFLNKFGFLLSFTHKFLPVPLNTEAMMQPVSVRDVATCIMNAVADRSTTGQTFDIGGPDVLTLRQMLEDVVFEHAMAESGRIVQVPEALADIMAKVQRRPYYHPDEVAYYKRDNIVPHGARMASDLGVQHRIALDDVAVNLLRAYRSPSSVYELTNSKF